MAVLVLLLIGWPTYVVVLGLLRALRAFRPATARAPQASADPVDRPRPPVGAQDGLAWTALDDLQLARLLDDSAP